MESKEIRFKNGSLWINPTVPPRDDAIVVDKLNKDYLCSLRLRLIFIPGHAHDGELGATLYRSQGQDINVTLPNSHLDDAVGPLYADGIISAAQAQLRESNLSSGDLVFDYRYYHPIDRSPLIFLILARCIVQLFEIESEQITVETIEDIAQTTYKRMLTRRKSE